MSLAPEDQRVVDNVSKFGWHCVNVPEDDIGPGFAFSVGFSETLNAPEAIIFGLRAEVMHHMLWEVFRQIKSGRQLTDGNQWPDLIEGFDCISRPVQTSHLRDYFGMALWFRRYRLETDDLRAYQLFWPGKISGLFPWEQGCDAAVIERQPALYLPTETGQA